ncbi:hypothetical protein SOVF_033590, partial [Spinacia oleracea]
CN